MFNLIQLWENTITTNTSSEEQDSRSYPEGTKPVSTNFDTNTVQSSFEFTKPPKIIFVKNISTLERADLYKDLPEVDLTLEEKEKLDEVSNSLVAGNKDFYDGKQILITGVVYDDSSNTLYMEAKKVFYSFISAMQRKLFPEGSQLYRLGFFKTGVLAPLITRDDQSILLERSRDGLYSVPSGFLEVHDEEERINFDDGKNFVTETAITELEEEIAGIKDSNKLSFEFSKTQVTSISFRKTKNDPKAMGTVEFVAPSYAHCYSSDLKRVLLTRLAKDAKEHTNQHKPIPLDSDERDTLIKTLLTGLFQLPGRALYLPIALSLSRLINQGAGRMMDLPRGIPYGYSTAWPLSFFVAEPRHFLSISELEDDSDESKSGNIQIRKVS